MKDVRIELAADISIFVGANNSGKTSATQAIHAFVSASKERFSLYDFCASCWEQFDTVGNTTQFTDMPPQLPSITLDLWFEVTEHDLHLVVDLLPKMEWKGTPVGMRIEFAASNAVQLIKDFQAIRDTARAKAEALDKRDNEKYVPWPQSLSEYLKKELQSQFEFRYYALDRAQFDGAFEPLPTYVPLRLGKEPSGAAILKSLVKVDNLSAQRHLADPEISAGSGRSEELSKRLSRFYKRNLDQRQEDHKALRALFDSEVGLNDHLSDVFNDTLSRLSKLGYPGLNNPRLEIRSALNPATIMSSQDARIHYVLGDGESALRLPDSYNGLGFKNLIYMVVEVLDLHARWIAEKELRAPLHLIFVEEPESHLHAQLQQVFIRNVLDLVRSADDGPNSAFKTQMVVTTHSPHIVYERGFQPIRYFKRVQKTGEQTTEVRNLSAFYNQNPDDRDFLQRYLKLTHCDLFFADAAILVEGNVERLLLPMMIEKEAPTLRSSCISILEVGGAFCHRFKSLIEFLGIAALVITDVDSVELVAENTEEDDQDAGVDIPDSKEEKNAKKRTGKACLPWHPNALTSNQTLIQWIPKKATIADLHGASTSDRTSEAEGGHGFKVCVTYQFPVSVTWNGTTQTLCGRTLEVAFGLENATWCQEDSQSHIGLKLRGVFQDATDLAAGLHKRVSGKSFDKTTFALGVLTEPPTNWHVPTYIKDGLHWLCNEVSLEQPITTHSSDTVADGPNTTVAK